MAKKRSIPKPAYRKTGTTARAKTGFTNAIDATADIRRRRQKRKKK